MRNSKSFSNTPSVSQTGGVNDLVPQRQHVGRYEIIYPIAQGGMAAVYVARLSGMAGFEKLYAVKVIHPHLSEDEAYINMFLDEARLAAGIQHPNVAETFEVGHDDGVLYMVVEFVHGQSLRAFYSRAATLGVDISQPVAAFVVSRVCQGLQAAHEHRGIDEQPLNIVHRDISPSNILISYDGFVKVIDFGVAYAQGRLSETVAGTIKGKIGFLPPEQIRGSELDGRADIFSLGVVLYIMTTGTPPFRSATEAEQLYKVLNGRFPLPREANPSVHPTLERIILTAMALRREDRYPNAEAMRKDLVRFIGKSGTQVGSDGLSKLMRSLFASDLAKHKELVKEFRSRRRTQGKKPGEADELTPSPHVRDDSISMVKAEAKKLQTEVVSRTMPAYKRLWLKTIEYILSLLRSKDKLHRLWSAFSEALVLLRQRMPRQRALQRLSSAQGAVIAGTGLLTLILVFSFVRGGAYEAPQGPANTGKLTASLFLFVQKAALGLSQLDASWSVMRSARVQQSPKLIRLTFTLSPQTAQVSLDGQLIPAGARTLELAADGSPHAVVISAAKYQPAVRSVIA
ncbi:MAG: serine/threonine protein kinase, partial [Myxococcota bacterium]|nr:serine/threonine protein kinase [Myxococcota bacterium]